MKAIRESEWFGLEQPAVKVSPARHQRARPLMRVVFAGTPEVALPALDAVAGSGHELVGVVTRPDAPAGRGRRLDAEPGRAARPRSSAYPSSSPTTPATRSSRTRCARSSPDCCPVVAYGALLPQSALDIPPHGWVNLHFSVLPAWRGAAPVQHAIWAGDEVTGATTFRIVKELDAGPTYGVMTERIRPDDTAGDLLDRLAEGGAGLLVATLDGIEDGSLEARAAAGRGRLASRRRSASTTPGSTGPRRRSPSTARSAPARPRRAPGRRTPASGSSSARCTLDRRARCRLASSRSARPRCWSAPAPTPSAR